MAHACVAMEDRIDREFRRARSRYETLPSWLAGCHGPRCRVPWPTLAWPMEDRIDYEFRRARSRYETCRKNAYRAKMCRVPWSTLAWPWRIGSTASSVGHGRGTRPAAKTPVARRCAGCHDPRLPGAMEDRIDREFRRARSRYETCRKNACRAKMCRPQDLHTGWCALLLSSAESSLTPGLSSLVGHGRGTRPAIETAMARVARICATRMPRGTSPPGRQLCLARGRQPWDRVASQPKPRQGRHFDDRRGPGQRQRIPLMMLNHRHPIQTSMSCAAPEGAWREAAARFPQAYAMGLQDLSPQGAWLATGPRHETCRNGARGPRRARSRNETCHNGERRARTT